MECAACGASAEGSSFSCHRDGLFQGPVVALCVRCGASERTLEQIWTRILLRAVDRAEQARSTWPSPPCDPRP